MIVVQSLDWGPGAQRTNHGQLGLHQPQRLMESGQSAAHSFDIRAVGDIKETAINPGGRNRKTMLDPVHQSSGKRDEWNHSIVVAGDLIP